jgi:hypothetical protein
VRGDGSRGGELLTLQGRLKGMIPDEVAEAAPAGTGVFAPVGGNPQDAGKPNAKPDLTLEKAGAAARKEREKGNENEMAIFSRFADEMFQRDEHEQKLRQASQSIRYEGGFRISIPGDAFDTSEVLRQAFPVDPGNGRISFDVPLQGTIYELTQRQADEIQALSEKR